MAYEFVYTQEIRMMMYAFGDMANTVERSAESIERILQTKMRQLLNEASKLMIYRKNKRLTIEDVCFVLRKDLYKVKRIFSTVVFKTLRKNLNDETLELEDPVDCDPKKFDWICNSETGPADTRKHERLKRIDELTSGMSKKEYLDYSECRQASFTYRKPRKFRDFIGPAFKIKDDLIDILGFIAYELVSDIVETSLKESGKYHNASKSKTPLTPDEISDGCRAVFKKASLMPGVSW